jgi:hypothetical protein
MMTIGRRRRLGAREPWRQRQGLIVSDDFADGRQNLFHGRFMVPLLGGFGFWNGGRDCAHGL